MMRQDENSEALAISNLQHLDGISLILLIFQISRLSIQ